MDIRNLFQTGNLRILNITKERELTMEKIIDASLKEEKEAKEEFMKEENILMTSIYRDHQEALEVVEEEVNIKIEDTIEEYLLKEFILEKENMTYIKIEKLSLQEVIEVPHSEIVAGLKDNQGHNMIENPLEGLNSQAE
jgi:hypothetical protein